MDRSRSQKTGDTTMATSRRKELPNGDDTSCHRCTGEGTSEMVASKSVAVQSSDENGHGSQECKEVPRPRSVAQRGTAATRLADSGRSPRLGLAGVGGAVAARARPAGGDAAGLAAK